MLKGGEWVGTGNLFNLGTEGWIHFFWAEGGIPDRCKKGTQCTYLSSLGGGIVTEYTYSGWRRRSCGAY